MHYTSHRTVFPEHNARYENGDTLTLGDGTEWEYFEASGWVPVAVRPVTNPLTGGIGFNGTIVDMDETPDDDNTEDYPVGTLFISPVE